MYNNKDDEDLRKEIFHLKKQLSNVNAENHLLKVKVRKLLSDIVKKDKEIDAILDPRKFSDIRKIIHERNASFVMGIKEQNEELVDLLHDKDMTIKKLQSQLEVVKLYSQQSRKYSHCMDRIDSVNKYNQLHFKLPYYRNNNDAYSQPNLGRKNKTNGDNPWNAGLQAPTSTLVENINITIEEDEEPESKKESVSDIKDQYRSLSKEHLLSIIENLKNNKKYYPASHQSSSRKSSPESDLERIELCDSPHEEVQQLHLHFLDMISEVDHLKYTISQLENKQQRTENVLMKKNNNVDKLAKELKNLKKPKSRSNKFIKHNNSTAFTNNETVTRIYSGKNDGNKSGRANNSDRRKKNNSVETVSQQELNEPKTTKNGTKVVTPQKEQQSCTCVYIENNKAEAMRRKDEASQTEINKENEDTCEDEVDDECEEEEEATNQ